VARARYMRRYFWIGGPVFLATAGIVQLLLSDDPLGRPTLQRVLVVTVVAAIIGMPIYRYQLGRLWEELRRDGSGDSRHR
jgi:hypothetical protein